MPHDHAHHADHHGHDHARMDDRQLITAVVINVALTVIQVVGGILSGSLALIADALHNFSDAASLVIAVGARRIARRPPDPSMTFGYARAEIVAALINFTTLILLGLYLGYEAILRLFDPQPIMGRMVVIVAGVALAVDAATAMLTYRMARDSMNIRAAFLHNLADALASVGVIFAGALILLYDFTLIDPILTLAIAGYVLWQGGVEIRGAVHILMNGTPEGMAPGEVAAAVRGVPGVADIHHLHLWRLSERSVSLEAHVVLAGEAVDPGEVKRRIRATMAERFGVRHVTLETERPGEVCDDRGAVAV